MRNLFFFFSFQLKFHNGQSTLYLLDWRSHLYEVGTIYPFSSDFFSTQTNSHSCTVAHNHIRKTLRQFQDVFRNLPNHF